MKVDPTDIYIVNLIYDLLVSMIIKIITPNFSIRQRSRAATRSHQMPPGGIKATRAFALPKTTFASSFGGPG